MHCHHLVLLISKSTKTISTNIHNGVIHVGLDHRLLQVPMFRTCWKITVQVMQLCIIKQSHTPEENSSIGIQAPSLTPHWITLKHWLKNTIMADEAEQVLIIFHKNVNSYQKVNNHTYQNDFWNQLLRLKFSYNATEHTHCTVIARNANLKLKTNHANDLLCILGACYYC